MSKYRKGEFLQFNEAGNTYSGYFVETSAHGVHLLEISKKWENDIGWYMTHDCNCMSNNNECDRVKREYRSIESNKYYWVSPEKIIQPKFNRGDKVVVSKSTGGKEYVAYYVTAKEETDESYLFEFEEDDCGWNNKANDFPHLRNYSPIASGTYWWVDLDNINHINNEFEPSCICVSGATTKQIYALFDKLESLGYKWASGANPSDRIALKINNFLTYNCVHLSLRGTLTYGHESKDVRVYTINEYMGVETEIETVKPSEITFAEEDYIQFPLKKETKKKSKNNKSILLTILKEK